MTRKKNLFEEKLKQGNFTILFNEILEPALKSDLTLTELKVFLHICRMTWGWKKDSEIIRVRDIVKELALDKRLASIALSGLKKKHFVDEKSTNRYQIQMDTSKWKTKTKIKTQNKDNSVDEKSTKKDNSVDEKSTPVDEKSTTNSQDSSKNANLQSPKDTSPKIKRKTSSDARTPPDIFANSKKLRTEKKPKPDDDVSLLNILKPKTLTTLKKQPFGLGEPKIVRLIKLTKKKNIDTHFSDCIEYILSRPDIDKPGRYFMTIISEGDEAPPPLYLTKRVELFNNFTGKEERAEKSTKFEKMVEKEVLQKAERKIKEINYYYKRENEKEYRQKQKIKLIHRICSLIKPSRLTKFKKKLIKVDPGNPNFKQAIACGYDLHTKRPYSDTLNEKVV